METKYLFLKVILMMGSLVAVIYAMNFLKPNVKAVPQVRSAKVIRLQAPIQPKALAPKLKCNEKSAHDACDGGN